MAGIDGLLVLPATLSHIKEIAPIMRKADQEEVLASGNYSPEDALRAAFFNSDFASTAWLHDKFAAMFGVLSRGEQYIGWLLTTDFVEDYQRLFYRSCREVLQDLLKVYPSLMNMVDDRHKRALRWANGLGFTIDAPVRFGPNQMLFRRIEIRRGECANRSRSALLPV